MYQFIKGLGPAASRQVGYERPKTLEEAIKIATAYESNFFPKKQSGNVDRPVMMDVGMAKSVKCFRCRKLGHIARDCSSPNILPGSDIPVWPRKRWDPSVEGKRSGRNFQRQEVHSDAKKHEQRAYLASDSTLPEINGNIDDYTVRMVIDSGASTSIISKRIANRIGLRVEKSGVQIRTADGEVVEVDGVTEEVKVEVGGEPCYMKMLVTNLRGTDVLLGWDWMKSRNAIIYPREGKLVFTKEVMLNARDLVEEEYMQ